MAETGELIRPRSRPGIDLAGLTRWCWITIPRRLGRPFLTVTAILSDGAFVTAWLRVGALALPSSLIIGALLGATHLFQDDIATSSVLVLGLMVVVGTIGTAFGAWLVAGYAAADLLFQATRGEPHSGSLGDWLLTLGSLPLTYLLLVTLVILAPTAARWLALDVARRVSPRIRPWLELPARTTAHAGLVYLWTLAAWYLVSPYYSWHGLSAPSQPVRDHGGWLVLVAVAAQLGRAIFEARAPDAPPAPSAPSAGWRWTRIPSPLQILVRSALSVYLLVALLVDRLDQVLVPCLLLATALIGAPLVRRLGKVARWVARRPILPRLGVAWLLGLVVGGAVSSIGSGYLGSVGIGIAFSALVSALLLPDHAVAAESDRNARPRPAALAAADSPAPGAGRRRGTTLVLGGLAGMLVIALLALGVGVGGAAGPSLASTSPASTGACQSEPLPQLPSPNSPQAGARPDIITVVGVDRTPTDTAIDPITGRVFTSFRFPGTVAMLDGRAPVPVPVGSPIAVGAQPLALDLDPVTGRLFVVDFGSCAVTVIDARAGHPAVMGQAIRVGAHPTAVAVDHQTGRVFVVSDNDTRLSVIDGRAASPAILGAPISLSASPNPPAVIGEIAVDSVTGHVYVGLVSDRAIAVVDGRAVTPRLLGKPIAVPGQPAGMAVDSASGRVVVANNGLADSISVLDGRANPPVAIGKPVPVGRNPSGVAFSPGNHRILVTLFGAPVGTSPPGGLVMLDADSLAIVDRLTLPNPDTVHVDPVTGRAFVNEHYSSSILVLSGTGVGCDAVSDCLRVWQRGGLLAAGAVAVVLLTALGFGAGRPDPGSAGPAGDPGAGGDPVIGTYSASRPRTPVAPPPPPPEEPPPGAGPQPEINRT